MVKLYDIHDRVILSKHLDVRSTKQIIDVNQLNTGIHIVELTTVDGNRRTQKLIIN